MSAGARRSGKSTLHVNVAKPVTQVGRQPWVVYGLLRTKDAVISSLVTADVMFSLLAYIAVYAVIYSFGLYYIYRVLRDGPAVSAALPGVSRAGAIRGGGE
jgi:cytochrome bd-type quinol oxidase subunit 1